MAAGFLQAVSTATQAAFGRAPATDGAASGVSWTDAVTGIVVMVVLQALIATLEVKEDTQVVEKVDMVEIFKNQQKMEILEKQVVENGKMAHPLGLEERLAVMVLQFVKQVV